MKTKKEIRQALREIKKTYTAEELEAKSEIIVQLVIALPIWQSAHAVLLYNALPDEVRTQKLIEAALHAGKQVFLPVVEGERLQLRRYNDTTRVEPEPLFGIYEPVGKNYPVCQYANIDLAVVPGMAFDSKGNRLGRGKGYYDKLLPKLDVNTVGICFDFQYLDEIPTNSHDIPMDVVVTENK